MIATNKPIELMSEDEIYHFGTIGMKWGVRRYQNKDGSLTPAGRKRAKKLEEKYEKTTGKKLHAEQSSGEKKKVAGPKDPSKMSNKELQAAIDRKRLEDDYAKAFPRKVGLGERVVKSVGDAAVKAVSEKATKVASEYVEKTLKKKLGLESETESLKNEVDKLKLEADKWKNKASIRRDQEAVTNSAEKGESERYKYEANKWKNKTTAMQNKNDYEQAKKKMKKEKKKKKDQE